MGRGPGGGGGWRERDRHRREYSPRIADERPPHSSRGEAPPSRHLWVGNLSPHVTHSMLSEQFLRFGDLEGISFLPGRSYAFVNYRKEEDAVMALRALRGTFVASSPLKIEFQKADKAFSPDAGYSHIRDERHSVERGDPFLRKDPGPRHNTHEMHEGDKNAEPSEVLWIGFPASLFVDEMALGRAFAPFGEIEKITTFPGRTYAFVRYRSVVAACRAKEALQGKLFNNPRVNICFARSDLAPEYGKHSVNPSARLNMKSNLPPVLGGRYGESVLHDRHFDGSVEEPHMPSPRFFSDMEKFTRDTDMMGISRNRLTGIDASSGSNSGGAFESTRFQGSRPERRLSEDPYDHFRHDRLPDRGGIRHDMAVERSRRGSHFEDSWDIGDADFTSAKKIRLDTFPDRELPEYPFSDFQKESEHPTFNRYTDLPEHQVNKSRFDSVPLGHKGYPDNSKNIIHPHESDDFWRASDTLDAGAGSLHTAAGKLQRNTPESRQPLKDEWKWEGTIAKGGTPVCRARCFPVGKVLDMMLPEFLDCTARTGLDMLAKHFYQAANSWVVFFVPETDADIAFYNEFMHFLGEKQRAAVAKLGEKTTLFLVPPSEFSEHVLKVPGKMSISGVILRFQQGNPSIGADRPVETVQLDAPSYPHQATNRVDFHDDASRSRRISPDFRPREESYFRPSSGHIVSPTGIRSFNKPDGTILYSSHGPHMGKVPGPSVEGNYDQPKHQNPNFQSNWPVKDMGLSCMNGGNGSSHVTNTSQSVDHHIGFEQTMSKSNPEQGMSSSHYIPGKPDSVLLRSGNILPSQETKAHVTPSAPLPTLQPEQLQQLASLLEQQKRLGKDPTVLLDGDQRKPVISNKTGNLGFPLMYDASGSHFSKGQILQQPNASMISHATDLEAGSIQQTQPNNREETETDPQKRLQATLQLAAALLQQIQQQSKGDQQ